MSKTNSELIDKYLKEMDEINRETILLLVGYILGILVLIGSIIYSILII